MTSPEMLSAHLSVAEFLATSHRALLDEQLAGFTPAIRGNAHRFALDPYEPAREVLGVPLHTNSGFRCQALNAAVGGAPTSRHLLGLAADLVPVGLDLEAAFRQIVAAMKAGQLPGIDQAILECHRWIHLQAAEQGKPRQMLLVAHFDPATHRMTYSPWRG